jgi:hypothetical protein
MPQNQDPATSGIIAPEGMNNLKVGNVIRLGFPFMDNSWEGFIPAHSLCLAISLGTGLKLINL